MKILQIIQKPQLRGAEIFACQLSVELMKRGHQVDVAYLFAHRSFDLDFNLNYLTVGAKKKFRFLDFRGYRRLANLIDKGNYDIVQCNAGDTLKYAVFSRWLFSWRATLVYRNANQISSFMRGVHRKTFNKLLLRHVDHIISVSETCRQDLVDFFPDVATKTRTITIGTYRFDDVAPIDHGHRSPIIVHVGSFVPEKNQLFLIKAFAAFSRRQPEARLWLVGDGPMRNTAQELVDNLGISTATVFWGYKKEVIRILKSASMLVLPSTTEGLPGVILEAFSCGIPVIASAVGGIPEVLVTGKTGICIQSCSVEEYVKAMERLLDDNYRSVVTENARALVREEYLMDAISQRFESAYQQLLEASRRE